MFPIEYQSYRDIFSTKLKGCKSKKDYKKLCKEMIVQFGVIDKVDANQCQIISSMIGSDNYTKAMALAIKMYILERQGIPYDFLSVEDYFNNFDS